MGVIIEIFVYILKGIFQLLLWTSPITIPLIILIAYQNLRKSKWAANQESTVLSVKIPKNSEKGPTAAEMMFASLHSILRPAKDIKREGGIQEHISFEIVADSSSITFYVWTPKHLQNFVEGQIYAQYPTAEITEVEDYARDVDIDDDGENDHIAGCELKLIKPDFFPIKTFQNFDVDPLAGITGALSKIEDPNEKMWIQIMTRPVSDQWRNKGLAYADSLKGGSPNIFSSQGFSKMLQQAPKMLLSGLMDAIFPPDSKSSGGGGDKVPHSVEVSLAGLEEKSNKLGFQVKVRILYVAKTKELAKQHLRITAGAFKQFNTTAWNGFTFTRTRAGNDFLNEYQARLFADKGYVLNIEEIASLYHLPHTSVETPNIVWTSSKKGEPPANLPYADDSTVDKNDLTVFAETTFRGQLKQFGIKKDDRRRHMYILGKSGAGKSKLLELLAVDDIERGEGVGIVDPHGELIHDVLKKIPAHRINDVVYINPADKDHPVGFNPMKATPDLREGVASGFVSVFKKQFGYSWGPRLEYLMRYAILALTYYPDTTMLDVVKILTDKDFRKKVLTYVEDPVVKTFWLKEFSTYNDKFATEAVAPILNKVGQFTASPTIRNIIGQTKETFDFEEAMNSQKIILVDLSSGKIGEDNSELLGSLMITKMQLSAMARAKLKPEDRKDFFLYVDEFQNFATEAFAKILSEARKYRLGLILANQYVAQMEEPVRDAVFGNVGTLISFRVGATDATYLEKEFSPTFEKDDLISLDNQHMYLNMLIDGVATNSFSAKSLFVKEGAGENVEKIIASSREKYSRPREEIEEQIRKWSNVDNLDVEKSVDRQKDSKFDGDDYVRIKKDGYQGASNQPRNDSRTPYKKPLRPISKPADSKDHSRTVREAIKEQMEAAMKETPDKVDTQAAKNLGTVHNETAPKPTTDRREEQKTEEPKREVATVEKPAEAISPEKLKELIQKVTKPTSAQISEQSVGEKPANVKPTIQRQHSGQRIEQPAPNVSHDAKTPLKPIEKPKPVVKNKKIGDAEGEKKTTININRFTSGATEQKQQTGKTAHPSSPTPSHPAKSDTTPKAPVHSLNKVIKRSHTDSHVASPHQDKNTPVHTTPKKEHHEEGVRKITREEFLNLKEIKPKEKIVIVDQHEKSSDTKEEKKEAENPKTNKNIPHTPLHREIKPGEDISF